MNPKGILFCLVLLLFPVPLYAEDNPPPLSQGDRAEVIEKKIIAEEVRQQIPAEEPAEPEIEKEEKPQPPLSKVPFSIKEVRLEGNTVISSEELEALTAAFENHEVTLNELNQLATEIEDFYRKRGYLTTYVLIPPQRLEEGIVKVQIIEGKIGEVAVEGNRYFRKKKILSYSKLQQGEILTFRKLRRTLNRMNQNPDRTVKGILREGKVPETTDIVFKVKDRFPAHLNFTYDNQGTKNIGKQRFGFGFRDTNLTSFDDIFSIGTFFNKNFGVLYLQHIIPLPFLDARLINGFSHGQSLPKKDLAPFGVNGTAQTYSSFLEKTIYDNERVELGVRGGFEIKESRTKVSSGTFQRTRLRIIRFGPTFRQQDRWGYTDLNQEFAFGVDGSYHGEPGARQGVDTHFFYYRGSFQRAQKVTAGMHARIRFEWQIPDTKLPAQEQMYLGGATTVRGYPESDYLADLGLLATLEYFIPLYFIPKDLKIPFTQETFRDRVEIVTFLDEGYGRLHGPSEREEGDQNLLGIGGGLQARLYRNLFAQTVWAAAIGNDPLTEAKHNQFHFRLFLES